MTNELIYILKQFHNFILFLTATKISFIFTPHTKMESERINLTEINFNAWQISKQNETSKLQQNLNNLFLTMVIELELCNCGAENWIIR